MKLLHGYENLSANYAILTGTCHQTNREATKQSKNLCAAAWQDGGRARAFPNKIFSMEIFLF